MFKTIGIIGHTGMVGARYSDILKVYRYRHSLDSENLMLRM
jgi:aspartate-semialdehyde dehydrogenase